MPAYSAIILFLAAWAASYHGTIVLVIEEWVDAAGPYNHGPIAVAVAGFIFWQKRSLLKRVRRTPGAGEFVLIIGFAVIWWLADAVNVIAVQQLSIYVILVLSMIAFYGGPRFASLTVPFGVILLALPIWNPLQPPLQELSTGVAWYSLSALGIPVLREGNQLTIPAGKFLVEEACAGLGFLLTALTLAGLYVYFNRVRGHWAVVYCLFATFVAVVANWMRVILIMVAGNYAGMDNELVRDHLTFGWILFALMFLPLFAVARFLPHGSMAVTAPEHDPGKRGGNRGVPHLIAIGLIIVCLPVMNQFRSPGGDRSPPPIPLADIFKRASANVPINWAPKFIGANETNLARYTVDGQLILGLTVHYVRQNQGAELIGSQNQLYDKERWTEISRQTVTDERGKDRYVRLVLRNRFGQYRHIAYWYVIAGKNTTRPVTGKLYELYGVITAKPGSSMIALAVDSGYQVDRSDDVLDRLVRRYQSSLTNPGWRGHDERDA